MCPKQMKAISTQLEDNGSNNITDFADLKVES